MEENSENTVKRIKTLKIGIFILIGILLVIIVARYITNEEFRIFVDTKILKKEIEQDTLSIIEINEDSSPTVFAYDKYIGILSKNTLKLYTSDSNEIAKLEVNISNPIISSNGKNLVIAESKGQKIYAIMGTQMAWQKDIEGSVSKVSINKNGYVSAIITNTTYKSVIISYNPTGKELFRTYLSSTYALCADISNDNKYLAIGEVDYTGTIVKSNVKIISIALAQSDPDNSIVNKYESHTGEVITNIKYHEKDNAICMFNNHIQKVTKEDNERLIDFNNDALFIDINLKDALALIEKQSSGLFSYEYQMRILSTGSNQENLYILNNDVPKNVLISGNIIGINLGTEVHLVNSKGLLLKKYKANQEIKGIALGDNIAGIIYKDKIELINL